MANYLFTSGGSGGSAPVSGAYVVTTLDAVLSDERVLTGTANQITVTDNGAGSTVVLSTPQNIATGSSPTFAGLTLTSNLAQSGGTVSLSSTGSSVYDASTSITIGGTNATSVVLGRSGQTTTVLSKMLAPVGGAPSAPGGYTFTGMTDTGMWTELGSPNQLYLTANGTTVLLMSNLDVTAGVKMFHPDGTAGVPSEAYISDGDTGTFRIGSGSIGTTCDGVLTETVSKNSYIYTQQLVTTGSPTCFTVTSAAHTGLTASTENRSLTLNFSASKQFSTGNFSNQREAYIQAPTYTAVGASSITTAATLAISGAPTAGSNIAITNNYALLVEGGTSNFVGVTRHAGGIQVLGNITESSTDSAIQIIGNRNAGTNGADVILRGNATRTGGTLCLIQNNTTDRFAWQFHGGMTLSQGAASSGTAQMLVLTGASHTGQTASTEINFIDVNQGTVTWAAGAITNQRCYNFRAPTLAFASASTVTSSATLYIDAAPVAGTNATITNPYSLWIDAGLPRIDSTSANATTATVLGSVGPAGANTTVQEWLTISINGTTRYIPCF